MQSRIPRQPTRQATDAWGFSEDRPRDHLLHRRLHDPIRLDRLALGTDEERRADNSAACLKLIGRRDN
jgi:hypothetical protein